MTSFVCVNHKVEKMKVKPVMALDTYVKQDYRLTSLISVGTNISLTLLAGHIQFEDFYKEI